MIKKTFVEEETLLNDAFCMAVSVYESGFAPTFIVGIWRGGSSVGIYVQECLQFLGVEKRAGYENPVFRMDERTYRCII